MILGVLLSVVSIIVLGVSFCVASVDAKCDVAIVFVEFGYAPGVGGVFCEGYGGCHYGVSEFAGECCVDFIVGNSDSNGFSAFEYFGECARRRKYECESSREVVFEEAECVVVDTCIFCSLRQAAADNCQRVFFGIDSFDFAKALNGPIVQCIAAEGVECVGWIDNYLPVAKCVDGGVYCARVYAGAVFKYFHRLL